MCMGVQPAAGHSKWGRQNQCRGYPSYLLRHMLLLLLGGAGDVRTVPAKPQTRPPEARWPEETGLVRKCGITNRCRWDGRMPIMGSLDRQLLWKARIRFGAYATYLVGAKKKKAKPTETATYGTCRQGWASRPALWLVVRLSRHPSPPRLMAGPISARAGSQLTDVRVS